MKCRADIDQAFIRHKKGREEISRALYLAFLIPKNFLSSGAKKEGERTSIIFIKGRPLSESMMFTEQKEARDDNHRRLYEREKISRKQERKQNTCAETHGAYPYDFMQLNLTHMYLPPVYGFI